MEELEIKRPEHPLPDELEKLDEKMCVTVGNTSGSTALQGSLMAVAMAVLVTGSG